MSLGEIARCLFKPRWADEGQFRRALNAFARLDRIEQAVVENMGAKLYAAKR